MDALSPSLGECLAVLGLRPGVSLREVKEAYKDLVNVWHPDRFSHDPRLQKKAQEEMKKINEAYEKLLIILKEAPPEAIVGGPADAAPDSQAVHEPASWKKEL